MMNFELTDPLHYMELEETKIKVIKTRKWIFGRTRIEGYKLCGKVLNRAEKTTYENLEIKIRLYGTDEKLLSKQQHKLSGCYPPSQRTDFEIELEEFNTEKFSHYRFLTDLLKADVVRDVSDIEEE